MQIQTPVRASAVVVQTTVLPSITVTVLPASAVPLMIGSPLVVLPLAGLLMTGAAGAVRSTVMSIGAEAGELLPAGSLALAVSV